MQRNIFVTLGVLGFFFALGAKAEDVRSCESYAKKAFETCYKELEVAIQSDAITRGNVATAQEGSVDAARGAEQMAQSSSYLKGVQGQYCRDEAKVCVSKCTAAAKAHNAKRELERANQALAIRDNPDQYCALLARVGNEATVNSAYLQSVSGDMGKTATALEGGAAGGAATGAGGGGGGGTMLWGLAGGAVGTLGALCLMGTICGDKDKDKNKEQPIDEAKIDCNKTENHVFQKCESHYLNLCKNHPTGPGCGEFNELYCGIDKRETAAASSSDGLNATSSSPASAGSTEGIAKVAAMAGVGSSFCQYQVAVDYCVDSGTEICPSCRQLQAARSPVCQQNPSLCLPGWTDEQKEQAKNYCPTDPMFIVPGAVADSATGGGTSPSTGSGTGSGGTIVGDGTSGTVPIGSGDGQAPTESENASLNQLSGEGTLTYGVASVRPIRSPASTLRPSLGPTLFQASSQVYQLQCQQGRLDNCGPRAGLGGSAQ